MISVNEEIGISVPENVEKVGLLMRKGVKIFRGLAPWRTLLIFLLWLK